MPRIMETAALSEKDIRKLLIALAIYLTSLFGANTLGLKIMPFPLGIHLSTGVFMFPVVFLMTDVIGEVYGKRMAKLFVYSGAVATLLFILYSLICMAAPWAQEGLWAHDSYNTIFAVSVRISIASVIAFVAGEYQDVIAFFFFRRLWHGSQFWARSMISALWSQFLDTVLFMTIAFYGVYPNPVLLNLIISWWLFKVAAGVLYSPLLYVGLWLMRDDRVRG